MIVLAPMAAISSALFTALIWGSIGLVILGLGYVVWGLLDAYRR